MDMIAETHYFVTKCVQIINNVTKIDMGCGQSQGCESDKTKEGGRKIHIETNL